MNGQVDTCGSRDGRRRRPQSRTTRASLADDSRRCTRRCTRRLQRYAMTAMTRSRRWLSTRREERTNEWMRGKVAMRRRVSFVDMLGGSPAVGKTLGRARERKRRGSICRGEEQTFSASMLRAERADGRCGVKRRRRRPHYG